MVFSDKDFFGLEENGFLDNKFEEGFDCPSTLSVRVLWLDTSELLEGPRFGERLKNIQGVDKSRISFRDSSWN